MMDAEEMAAALTFELNEAPWKAISLGLGEIKFINEDGEEFRLTVEEWNSEWDDTVPEDDD